MELKTVEVSLPKETLELAEGLSDIIAEIIKVTADGFDAIDDTTPTSTTGTTTDTTTTTSQPGSFPGLFSVVMVMAVLVVINRRSKKT